MGKTVFLGVSGRDEHWIQWTEWGGSPSSPRGAQMDQKGKGGVISLSSALGHPSSAARELRSSWALGHCRDLHQQLPGSRASDPGLGVTPPALRPSDSTELHHELSFSSWQMADQGTSQPP